MKTGDILSFHLEMIPHANSLYAIAPFPVVHLLCMLSVRNSRQLEPHLWKASLHAKSYLYLDSEDYKGRTTTHLVPELRTVWLVLLLSCMNLEYDHVHRTHMGEHSV